MADTDNDQPIVPETGAPQPLKNEAEREAEELKKQLEQARMRTQQLENERAERLKKEEEAKQKQLEENNRYKELWENEKRERENLETENERRAREAEVASTTSAMLSEYDDKVVNLAKTAGLILTDTSDEAKQAFSEKLAAIAKEVNAGKKVQGNNTPPSTDSVQEEDVERAKNVQRMRYDDPAIRTAARHEAIGKHPILEQMRKSAGISLTQ